MTTQTATKAEAKQYLDIAGKIGQKQQQKFVTVEENGSKVAKRIVEFSIGSTIDGETLWTNACAWENLGTKVYLKLAAQEPIHCRGYIKTQNWTDKETGVAKSREVFVLTTIY